jgi:hypothetical protein
MTGGGGGYYGFERLKIKCPSISLASTSFHDTCKDSTGVVKDGPGIRSEFDGAGEGRREGSGGEREESFWRGRKIRDGIKRRGDVFYT